MSLPDLIEIVPLDKPVQAEITVPGSKSITNRALILAALADGEVTLEGALWSEDTQIMTECLQELGFMVDVRPDPNETCNRTITVYGQSGNVPPGGTGQQPMELFVGNAGTAARFLAAFVCLGKGVYRLHGVPRMHERPQAALFKALRELGYRVESENGNEKLPAKIWSSSRGNEAQTGSPRPADQRGEGSSTGSSPRPSPPLGEERGTADAQQGVLRHSCTVSIEESSQFASALLLCAAKGGWEIKVTGENAEESPYVAMTLKLIEAFPKRGGKFQIEPDASSGSYFLAANWLVSIGSWMKDFLKVTNYWAIHGRFHTLWEWIRKSHYPGQVKLPGGELAVSVRHWPSSGWQIDEDFRLFIPLPDTISREAHLGDSIMMSIVLAADVWGGLGLERREKGIRFTDLGRLRVQECERVVALRTELKKCGANVVEEEDTLTIMQATLHGAEIETYDDHRMAMCFAILGLKVPGIKIKNPACVKKTFPNFFQKLAASPPNGLGATIRDAKTGRTLSEEELFAD
jgi:3-phosphoshikimate 1-carboxyvinyltransferase